MAQAPPPRQAGRQLRQNRHSNQPAQQGTGRSLSIEKPVAIGEQDPLLMYYYYQESVRGSDLSPDTDPMLIFKSPASVGLPASLQSRVDIYEWSVGGFQFAGDAPLRPTAEEYRAWKFSYITRNYGGAEAKFCGNISTDPSLSINLPRFFEAERERTYRKLLRNSAVQEFLGSFSADSGEVTQFLINLQSQVGGQNAPIINALGITVEEVFGTTLDAQQFVVDDEDTLWTIIDRLNRNPEAPRDDAAPPTLAPGFIFRSIIGISRRFPRFAFGKLLELAANSPEYQNPEETFQWSYYRTNQVTPFVDQYESRLYLNESRRTSKPAAVSPNYNLYIPGYEKSIALDSIHETSLTNGYAYHLVSDSILAPGVSPDAGDLRIPSHNLVAPELLAGAESPEWPGIDPILMDQEQIRENGEITIGVMSDALTFGGDLPRSAIYQNPINPNTRQASQEDSPLPSSVSDYYTLVSRTIGSTTSSSGEVTETIILPATDQDLVNDFSGKHHVFPFNISVSFRRDAENNHASTLIYQQLQSVGVLSGLSASVPAPRECSVETSNLAYIDGRVQRTPIRRQNKGLMFYDLPDIISYGSEDNQLVKPLVVTDHCMEGSTGLRPYPYALGGHQSSLGTSLQGVANVKSKKYQEILDISSRNSQTRSHTTSEAIGYKITKYRLNKTEENIWQPGPTLQTIMIGNTPILEGQRAEVQDLTYVDTQIKYGDVYGYSLFEYRLIYSTEYELFMDGLRVPAGLEGNIPDVINALMGDIPSPINYRCYVLRRPKIELVEVPVYDRTFYATNDAGDRVPWDASSAQVFDRSFGISYPPVKVMDAPPPPPDIEVFPLKGRKNQVKIRMSPSTGVYEGLNALPIVFIPHGGTFHPGDGTSFLDIMRYQRQYAMPPPEPKEWPGEVGLVATANCKSEGVTEIKAMRVYRSLEIDQTATSSLRAYQSFDPEKNPDSVRHLTLINTLYAPEMEVNEDSGQVGVLSFNITDEIETNTYYYYTCVAVDAHDNVSSPSAIYQVRLVYDKGLLIPEVNIYEHSPMPATVPTKKFARFMQIRPSPLQSNPFTERDDEGRITSIRNLAGQPGQSSIVGNKFIVRLTSRDTGRKFDIELDFNYEDNPIADEEE